MWAGVTNVAHSYIAQSGFGETVYQNGGTPQKWLWDEFWPSYGPINCNVSPNSGDNFFVVAQNDAYNRGYNYVYDVNSWDATLGKGCAYSGYNWSTGLGSNSYFALLMGEVQPPYHLAKFTQTNIVGTVIDQNNGPSGYTISWCWNNNYWESFYVSYGGHSATESAVGQYSSFKLNFK
jgi:hypothetical protein